MLEEETVDAGHPKRIRLECMIKNRRIFAIRKMEAPENAGLFGFLIPDLRLEMVVDGGGKRIGVVLLGPVELS